MAVQKGKKGKKDEDFPVLIWRLVIFCAPTEMSVPYLTFRNRASYIWDGRTATLQMLHFVYFFQQI